MIVDTRIYERQYETSIPDWASRFIADNLAWCEEQGYKIPAIGWEWYDRETVSSSGLTTKRKLDCPARIRIYAGSDDHDLHLVVLHELAHAVTNSDHTLKTYRLAWKLYKRNGLDLTECLRREGSYQPQVALKAYAMEIGEC